MTSAVGCFHDLFYYKRTIQYAFHPLDLCHSICLRPPFLACGLNFQPFGPQLGLRPQSHPAVLILGPLGFNLGCCSIDYILECNVVINCSFSNLLILLTYVINCLRITCVHIMCICMCVDKMFLFLREFRVDYEYSDVYDWALHCRCWALFVCK